MITRKHRVQLLLFVLLAVSTVVYTGANYAGLDRLFGARGYVVTAQLADSGGIFVNSEVAYRGVAVGKVASMTLTPQGVNLELDIDSDAPPIPADTRAVVANRSAVGEQYVDLEPQHENGPYLKDGSVITQAQTSIPLSPDTVLSSLDKLVSSVHPESLRTVVDETYKAFAGAGPDLQKLLDSTGSLTSVATQYLPQTQGLLADAKVVLDTQQRQSANITSFASGLKTITEQLKKSDPDLRKVIDDAPKLSRQITDVLTTSGSDLGVVIANLLTTAQITSSRTGAVEELLVAYPIISAFSPSTSGDGTGHLGVVLNFFDPISCTKGYEGTKQRPANDVTEAPVNVKAYCAEPPGSPTGVRGSQNAPFAGKPAPFPDKPSQPAPSAPQLPGVLSLATAGRPGGLGPLLGLPK
ncbi:phospholipid/cholesterol/gamma-HCH transport system substrate-binding protein [Amycolatopsis xylanica]|uniref:Phospholipid/cholesterol/gamma-HCH transport system substrate-binding protein n=1 Tax=Amycolatopsis xylanica TaxID=589385 RepID=A0A1H3Q329_9PSEU|nr:MCE family protein [Amycolatopsis xylanica]SDZ07139.1 phospholipid/cholesterol/gamma-HCH transport system substrate-binding protein [Amycolatopsis xylanica]